MLCNNIVTNVFLLRFTAPPDPIIGLGSLFVHFHSDASVNYRGFQATYSSEKNRLFISQWITHN